MSPTFSIIFITCHLMMFLAFLCSRADQLIKWNWFCVFIPLFSLQFCIFVDVLSIIIRNRLSSSFSKLFKWFTYMFSLILLFGFEVLICLRLEYFKELMMFHILLPFWLLIVIVAIYLTSLLIK